MRYIAQLALFRLNRLIGAVLLFVRLLEPSAPATMVKDDSSYKYTPLAGPNATRLLRIHRGRPSQAVECSFETHQLEDGKEYEAISYVWGEVSPDSPTQIVLRGCAFSIT